MSRIIYRLTGPTQHKKPHILTLNIILIPIYVSTGSISASRENRIKTNIPNTMFLDMAVQIDDE